MLKRIYWVAYAAYLIRQRHWKRRDAVQHVRRLYRYERRRQRLSSAAELRRKEAQR